MSIELDTERAKELDKMNNDLKNFTEVLNDLITRASKLEVQLRIAVENSEFFNGVKIELTEDAKEAN